jgi:hypothetical protein
MKRLNLKIQIADFNPEIRNLKFKICGLLSKFLSSAFLCVLCGKSSSFCLPVETTLESPCGLKQRGDSF